VGRTAERRRAGDGVAAPDDALDQERDATLKVFKYSEKAKKYELTWLQQSVMAHFDGDNITVALNGTQLYNGPITGASAEQAKAVVDPIRDLLRIGGAVEADLKSHYGPPQREVTNCCGMEPGNIVCSGGQYWATGYSLWRSEACASAEAQVHMTCWNAYCTGCCAVSSCNAVCFEPPLMNSDFLCAARVKGTACRCSLFVY
jgi:hypothetical protein